tara:strand:+ start:917 stop:1849 length:933 start_codon:yes stop_codon:yes gene_type:complete
VDDILKNLIKQFMPFAQKHIGFTSPPRLFLKIDDKNAKNPLGKTAYYNPEKKSVFLYISGRHPKDILRSLGHELVHHKQHCDGMFDGSEYLGAGYAQKDPLMRNAEELANKDGSMCLRDFEDMLKAKNETIYYEHLQEGDYKMSFNDWKEKEISTLLAEAWGFKFNTLEEFNEFNGKGELQAESEEEIAEEAVAKEATKEAVEGSTTEDVVESVDDVEELEEFATRGGSDERRKPHGAGEKKKKELEEVDDAEELEETGLADRPENAPQAKAGRGGKARYKRAIPEAKVREVLKKAIQIVKENNKAPKKG